MAKERHFQATHYEIPLLLDAEVPAFGVVQSWAGPEEGGTELGEPIPKRVLMSFVPG